MRPELAAADRALVAAIERASEARAGLDYRIGSLITGADPGREVAQVEGYRREWLKKAAAVAPDDVATTNRLVAAAQEYVRLADSLAGLTSSVTLTRAVEETAKDTARDIGEAASMTKRLLPWLALAVVLVVLAGLYIRTRGN